MPAALPSTPLYLGIDTGGTYTDGVLFEPAQRRVLRTAKVLTSHHDLTLCIGQVLDQLAGPGGYGSAPIACVALSTTLATNAIAEGKRQPVALLLLGYDQELVYHYQFQKEFGTDLFFFIAGRHNLEGLEECPLDEAAVTRSAGDISARVGAFAVSAYAGPVNARFEERSAELLRQLTGKPVVQAHHLSGELNSIRRATTASLNAALLANMDEFIAAVRQMLAQRGLGCPTLVVRGDGSLVNAAYARQRPIEVVHSGPATSTIGGQFLSGLDEALVIDIGGTTTDIALVENGRVRILEQAATVGPYRTCVRTIKTRSFGLGGDSQIRFDHLQNLAIGPERVVPLSLLFHQHPQLQPSLAQQLRQRNLRYWDEVEYWSLLRPAPETELDSRTRQIVALLRQGPQSYQVIRKTIGPLAPIFIEGLVNRGIIQRAGLTPTDLLHVSGEFSPWDHHTAALVTEQAARNWSLGPLEFVALVKKKLTQRIVEEIVQFITGKRLTEDSLSGQPSAGLDRWLFNESLQPNHTHLGCRLSLRLPVVGIGAPAHAFLPAVAEALGSEIIIPEHHQVANAIGAVVGNIAVRQTAEVTPAVAGALVVGYYARVGGRQEQFARFEDALDHARTRLAEDVRKEAQAAGAGEVVVEMEENPYWEGMVQLAAWAVGKPALE
jgi:N-methylhydantoinase A/oxoprolinase/acetone carboxylase beta subunit